MNNLIKKTNTVSFNNFIIYKLKKIYLLILVGLVIFFISPKGGTWSYLVNLRWLYVLIFSFIVSNLFTPLCIKIAFKFNFLDIPDERKMHSVPVPRIGGLAIYISVITVIIRNLRFSAELLGLLIGGSLIFMLGFLDDIRGGLSATFRLFIQILSVVIVFLFGLRISFIPHIPLESFWELLITILWFVGIINAINFLDGIDGLVSSFGIFCSLIFLLISWQTQQNYITYITASLIGSCLGFLPYNWTKAKIFLGDCGATFIGFMLAGISVMGTWAENNPVIALSTPLLILAIPIFDVIYTTISRIKNKSVKNLKQWLEFVGKDHFHHRLLKFGFNIEQTVGFIIFLNLAFGLSALIIRQTGTFGAIILLIQSVVILLIVVILMLAAREGINNKNSLCS